MPNWYMRRDEKGYEGSRALSRASMPSSINQYVEDYYKGLDVITIHANMGEDETMIMPPFYCELNPNIASLIHLILWVWSHGSHIAQGCCEELICVCNDQVNKVEICKYWTQIYVRFFFKRR